MRRALIVRRSITDKRVLDVEFRRLHFVPEINFSKSVIRHIRPRQHRDCGNATKSAFQYRNTKYGRKNCIAIYRLIDTQCICLNKCAQIQNLSQYECVAISPSHGSQAPRPVRTLSSVQDRVLAVSYDGRTQRHAGTIYKEALELHFARVKVLRYLQSEIYETASVPRLLDRWRQCARSS